MFRSNIGELFFLRRETSSKENAKKMEKIVNMKIATNFKVVELG